MRRNNDLYFLFQVFEDALEEAAPTEKQKKLKSRVVKKLPKFRLKEKAAAKNGNGDIEDSSQGPTLQNCFALKDGDCRLLIMFWLEAFRGSLKLNFAPQIMHQKVAFKPGRFRQNKFYGIGSRCPSRKILKKLILP